MFALSLLTEVPHPLLQNLGKHGLVLHLHRRRQIVVPLEHLVIVVLIKRASVVVLLHKGIASLCLVFGRIRAQLLVL